MAVSRKTSKHVDLERDGLAIKAEYLQTPMWAIEAILRAEILTYNVVDPCCGDGRMATAADKAGYNVFASDMYDWDGSNFKHVDFLDNVFNWPGVFLEAPTTVFMNPPFSLACEFVDRAFQLGARKVVMFQRSVWRESACRREWFERNPPNRIYVCGNRADCWYGTIPEELRKGGSYQPHSFYVWEKGHPPGTLYGSIWKE